MIDIDRIDEQLAALAPAPSRTTSRRRRVNVPSTPAQLLELGRLEEADAAMAAGAHPRDALTWATMRALLDGREEAARSGVEELRRLGQLTDDPAIADRYWLQRYWFAFEWGTEEERFDVLDHCRERAYRFEELPWWGNLTLLLAGMGKADEATRAFDETQALVAQNPSLDVVTNLVEAAAGLGDAGRVAAAARTFRWPEGRLVVVDDGVVCKGSIDRYRALVFAAAGRWKEAGECFRAAESTHHRIDARPLLARTRQQAAGSLVAA